MSLPKGIIPAPQVRPDNIAEVVRILKHNMDALTGVGDPAGRVLTLQDIGSMSGSGTVVLGGNNTGGEGYDPYTDYTTPPPPTGLTVSGAMNNFIIRVDPPPTVYKNQAYIEIWASSSDSIGTATLRGLTTTNFLVLPATGVESLYFWARSVSLANITGPYNQTEGTLGTTGPDVEYLLEQLDGQITNGQLSDSLSQSIRTSERFIDEAAADVLAAALATHEEKRRATAATAEAVAALGADLLAEAAVRGTDITETRRLVNEGDAQLAQQVTTLTATVATNLGTALAAVESSATAQANALAVEASTRELLATTMFGQADVDGLTLETVQSGLLFEERQARSTETGALSLRTELLEASVTTPGTGLLARATALESVTTDASSGNTALAERTQQLEAAVTDPGGLLTRATALENITTNVESGNAALASRTSLLEASIDDPTSGLLARASVLEATTTNVVSGNSALAVRALNLESAVTAPGGLLARATALETLTTDASIGNGALAIRTSELESVVEDPVTGVEATALALETVQTEVFSGPNRNSVLATRTQTLESKVDSPSASPGSNYNPTWAALQLTQNTLATLDGRASVAFTLRAQLSSNGRNLLGGFGLMGDSTSPAGSEFEFGVMANRFWVGAPIGSGFSDRQLFTVQTTTWDDNGVMRPPGAYLEAAYIKNLVAVYATIGSLVAYDIAAADIEVAQLKAGTLRVGGYIQSDGYVPNSAGWRINANGTAEFSGVIVRGTIYATAGYLRGVQVQAADGSVIISAGATSATTSISGNVTGQVFGVAASTLTAQVTDSVNKLADIASDGRLTPVEKQQVRIEWQAVYTERDRLRAQADTYGAASQKANYDSAFQALGDYLNSGPYTISPAMPFIIQDARMSVTDDVNRVTFRNLWTTLYFYRQELVSRIYDVAATLAVWDNISGAGKPESGATVGAPAGTLVAGIAAEALATAATNFNASNDRNGAAIVAPTIAVGGVAVDHTLRSDGSADISFEWQWSGDNGDIDGFQVYVRQSASSAVYSFGTNVVDETVYEVPAVKRAMVLFGVQADMYYTFGVRAYRRVDKDVVPGGVVLSALVKPTAPGEDPYRPSSVVAFSGDITGTVAGTPAATLVATAADAASDASTALAQSLDANNKLADIGSDFRLTPVEKQYVRREWDAIYAERADIRAKADAMGGTATQKLAYDNAFEDLGDYMNGGAAYTIGTTRPLWIRDATQMGETTVINGDVFRATWSTLYTARQILLNKIAEVAATKAQWSGVTGDGRPEDGATVGAPPGTPVGSTTADVVAAAAAAVNDVTTGLAQRLRANAQNVLAGAGGLATGSLTWNSSGVRTGGSGVGLSQRGLVAYNSSGNPTIILDGTTGDATFTGTVNVQSASSGARMEITNSVIKVFDSSGNVRVKIGDLS